MAILIRILLLLLPMVGLIMWLRWRARRKAGEEISDGEYLRLQITLGGIAVMLLVAGLSLKFIGDSGAAGQVYVPAKIVDGQLIEGHFIDPEKKSETDPAPKKSGGENDDTSKNEGSD
ncbi:MAG: hypothetical protein COB37_08670 [Kordiimonadales bacterium]|nr:MAG: hypothetical protein COB37_08670 [Kordiimonadales bacterium]